MKHTTLLATLLTTLLIHALAPRARAEVKPYERWYVTQMDGKKMGWMREWLEVTPEGYHTAMEMNLRIGRGPGAVAVVLQSEFLETRTGEPIRMIAKSQMGSSQSSTLYEFAETEVRIEERSAGQELSRTAPLPAGEWLTPGEADQYVHARLEAGAGQRGVRPGAADFGEQIVGGERAGAGGDQDVLAQHVQRPRPARVAIQRMGAHGVKGGHAFDHLEAVGRHHQRL